MRLNTRSLVLAWVVSSVTVLAAPQLVVGADELATQTTPLSPNSTKGPAGRKDAPVDGKDGRPHEGPWVETEADRTRKQSGSRKDEDAKAQPERSSKLPESNDGVMDDRHRSSPKEGTRGTEGGISEKSREKGENVEAEKRPEAPKEVPSLPHSEESKITPVEEASSDVTPAVETATPKSPKSKEEEEILGEVGGLKKPELPEKPHDIPHPVPIGSSEKDPLEIKQPSTPGDSTADPTTLIQPLHSFFLAFTMIIFSEIGDKTFLVAALMAMKHPPLLVFTAAFSALFVMTILSALLGHAVPALLSVKITNFLAAILFLVFGAKMLKEGYALSPNEGVGEEMREVEMELEEKEQMARRMQRRRSDLPPYMLEGGHGSRKSRSSSRLPAPPDSPPSSPDSRSPSPSRVSSVKNALSGVNNLCSFLLSPAWVQTFVMTFLGEWGDRSQIATIAMSAGQDYWFVAMGSLVGHSICTAGAVIGGRAIAGRVSLRIVTLGGAFAFLAFGFIYLAEALYYK